MVSDHAGGNKRGLGVGLEAESLDGMKLKGQAVGSERQKGKGGQLQE